MTSKKPQSKKPVQTKTASKSKAPTAKAVPAKTTVAPTVKKVDTKSTSKPSPKPVEKKVFKDVPSMKKAIAEKVIAQAKAKTVVAKKPAVKAAVKPVNKAAVKKEVVKVLQAPKAELVHTSELTAQVIHAQSSAPWDGPSSFVTDPKQFAKPAAVKAPTPTQNGLSMAQVKTALVNPMATPTPDRSVGAPYLRSEPVKTSGGISIKDVMRHIGQSFNR